MTHKADIFYKYVKLDEFKDVLHMLCEYMFEEVFYNDKDTISYFDVPRMINNALSDDSFANAFFNTYTYYKKHKRSIIPKLTKVQEKINDIDSTDWKVFKKIFDKTMYQHFPVYFLDFFKFFKLLIYNLTDNVCCDDTIKPSKLLDIGEECSCKVMIYFFVSINKADTTKQYFDYKTIRNNMYENNEDTLLRLTETYSFTKEEIDKWIDDVQT